MGLTFPPATGSLHPAKSFGNACFLAEYTGGRDRLTEGVCAVCAANVLTVGKACLSFEREPIVVPYPDNDVSTTSLIKAAFESYKEEEVLLPHVPSQPR